MPEIKIVTDKEILIDYIEKSSNLSEVIHKNNIVFAMPCNGNHTCGKCKVKVSGDVSPMTSDERRLLTEDDVEKGIRLACFTKIEGDLTVFVSDNEIHTLSDTVMPEFDINNANQGEIGIACDIGTTTVAMRAYNLQTGKLIGETLEANKQSSFGADVISRIEYSNVNGVAPLQSTIQTQLEDMSKACLKDYPNKEITSAVITGNTTMLHLYDGLDPRGIAVAPFTPQSLFGMYSNHELQNAKTYLPKCIGSYIGADIVCGIVASGMRDNNEKSLLVDIGTNGEMAMHIDGKFRCCSTAAGPAFEGAGLYMGMPARNGAISKIALVDDKIEVGVIGNGKAVGICGSGIIDAVSVMIRLEVIDETGVIDEEYMGEGEIVEIDNAPAFKLPQTDVVITQKDIRQIQLAKSAICAGIMTLLQESNVSSTDIDSFYIAGGFGHYMDKENATIIGLFPKELLSKVKIIGNSALSGSIMMLLNESFIAEADDITNKSEEIQLSSSESFMDNYVECMIF